MVAATVVVASVVVSCTVVICATGEVVASLIVVGEAVA